MYVDRQAKKKEKDRQLEEKKKAAAAKKKKLEEEKRAAAAERLRSGGSGGEMSATAAAAVAAEAASTTTASTANGLPPSGPTLNARKSSGDSSGGVKGADVKPLAPWAMKVKLKPRGESARFAGAQDRSAEVNKGDKDASVSASVSETTAVADKSTGESSSPSGADSSPPETGDAGSEGGALVGVSSKASTDSAAEKAVHDDGNAETADPTFKIGVDKEGQGSAKAVAKTSGTHANAPSDKLVNAGIDGEAARADIPEAAPADAHDVSKEEEKPGSNEEAPASISVAPAQERERGEAVTVVQIAKGEYTPNEGAVAGDATIEAEEPIRVAGLTRGDDDGEEVAPAPAVVDGGPDRCGTAEEGTRAGAGDLANAEIPPPTVAEAEAANIDRIDGPENERTPPPAAALADSTGGGDTDDSISATNSTKQPDEAPAAVDEDAETQAIDMDNSKEGEKTPVEAAAEAPAPGPVQRAEEHAGELTDVATVNSKADKAPTDEDEVVASAGVDVVTAPGGDAGDDDPQLPDSPAVATEPSGDDGGEMVAAVDAALDDASPSPADANDSITGIAKPADNLPVEATQPPVEANLDVAESGNAKEKNEETLFAATEVAGEQGQSAADMSESLDSKDMRDGGEVIDTPDSAVVADSYSYDPSPVDEHAKECEADAQDGDDKDGANGTNADGDERDAEDFVKAAAETGYESLDDDSYHSDDDEAVGVSAIDAFDAAVVANDKPVCTGTVRGLVSEGDHGVGDSSTTDGSGDEETRDDDDDDDDDEESDDEVKFIGRPFLARTNASSDLRVEELLGKLAASRKIKAAAEADEDDDEDDDGEEDDHLGERSGCSSDVSGGEDVAERVGRQGEDNDDDDSTSSDDDEVASRRLDVHRKGRASDRRVDELLAGLAAAASSEGDGESAPPLQRNRERFDDGDEADEDIVACSLRPPPKGWKRVFNDVSHGGRGRGRLVRVGDDDDPNERHSPPCMRTKNKDEATTTDADAYADEEVKMQPSTAQQAGSGLISADARASVRALSCAGFASAEVDVPPVRFLMEREEDPDYVTPDRSPPRGLAVDGGMIVVVEQPVLPGPGERRTGRRPCLSMSGGVEDNAVNGPSEAEGRADEDSQTSVPQSGTIEVDAEDEGSPPQRDCSPAVSGHAAASSSLVNETEEQDLLVNGDGEDDEGKADQSSLCSVGDVAEGDIVAGNGPTLNGSPTAARERGRRRVFDRPKSEESSTSAGSAWQGQREEGNTFSEEATPVDDADVGRGDGYGECEVVNGVEVEQTAADDTEAPREEQAQDEDQIAQTKGTAAPSPSAVDSPRATSSAGVPVVVEGQGKGAIEDVNVVAEAAAAAAAAVVENTTPAVLPGECGGIVVTEGSDSLGQDTEGRGKGAEEENASLEAIAGARQAYINSKRNKKKRNKKQQQQSSGHAVTTQPLGDTPP